MSNIAALNVRANRAGVAMRALGHRAAWQVTPLVDAHPTFAGTFAIKHVTLSHKGNPAWGPPSA